MFLVNGVGWASWAARLPAIQERLSIGEGAVGVALLGATLGLFVAVVATSVLVERFGSRRVTMASGATMIAALPLIGWAPSFPMLAAALVIYGAANGAFDLAINSQAVTVERAYGRPMMSSFCVLLAEGSVTDWSAIYLSSVVGTGPGLAAAGLIVFSLTMMLGRLFWRQAHAAPWTGAPRPWGRRGGRDRSRTHHLDPDGRHVADGLRAGRAWPIDHLPGGAQRVRSRAGRAAGDRACGDHRDGLCRLHRWTTHHRLRG